MKLRARRTHIITSGSYLKGYDGMSGVVWAFLFFCVFCGTICRIATARVQSRDRSGTGADDMAMVQEVHRGLKRMEDRLEALETIIMDRPKSRDRWDDPVFRQ